MAVGLEVAPPFACMVELADTTDLKSVEANRPSSSLGIGTIGHAVFVCLDSDVVFSLKRR